MTPSGGGGVEGAERLSPKENRLMNMDNSVVIAGGGGGGAERCNGTKW